LFAGAALVGAGVTLFGCGGGSTPEDTPAPTPAVTPAPTPAPGPVKTAWDNHFAAFGAGADQIDDATMTAALEKIMLDYDAESKLAVFNDACQGNKVDAVDGSPPTKRDGYAEYTSLLEIEGFFRALFTQLGSAANLDKVGPIRASNSPSILEGDLPKGNVFLTWITKGLTGKNEITYATDSFSWAGNKVLKQNVVVTEPQKACESVVAVENTCVTGNKVCDGWNNHFAAFGAGQSFADDAALETALTKIMLDYTADSIVQVFDHRTEAYTTFDTPDKIKEMFKQLFTAMQAAKNEAGSTGLAVKLLEVEPTGLGGQGGGVFLVWESLSHPKATDTFVFDDVGKIIRQNIVVFTKDPAFLKVQV